MTTRKPAITQNSFALNLDSSPAPSSLLLVPLLSGVSVFWFTNLNLGISSKWSTTCSPPTFVSATQVWIRSCSFSILFDLFPLLSVKNPKVCHSWHSPGIPLLFALTIVLSFGLWQGWDDRAIVGGMIVNWKDHHIIMPTLTAWTTCLMGDLYSFGSAASHRFSRSDP